MLMSWKGPVESHEVKGAEEQPLTGQKNRWTRSDNQGTQEQLWRGRGLCG